MTGTVGRYQIIEKVGEGPIGTVYRAQDPATGNTIALKVMHFDPECGDDERAQIVERLRGICKLSHPNIAMRYEVDIEGDRAYIAREFVEGQTVAQIIAE